MSLDYLIRPQARVDIDDAYEWYELQQPGRGGEFLVEFHQRIDEIRKHPHVSCLVSSKVRAVRLEKSKFIIYFKIDPDRVRILAVHHERAHPNRRRGRT